MSKYCLLFCCFCLGAQLRAQTPVEGVVVDQDGIPLAFVSVLINDDPGKGVLTDIEGRFRLGTDLVVRSLTFRYVGFETLRLDAAQLLEKTGKALRIKMTPSQEYLPEASVVAGENPADQLIRKAIAHRDRNNPEHRKAYRCNTYNKIVFDALPNREAYQSYVARPTPLKKRREKITESFEKTEARMAAQHIFLMESVTERSFRFPQLLQEKVKLNRVSGLQNSGIVALANAVQPFSFYGDFLRILDKNFVNPISPGSPKLYFFNIEDTLYTGTDTIWVISFHPRKGKVFEGLEGVLHLHSHHWALQNVRAAQANKNGNLQLKIEQAYEMVEIGGPQDTTDAQCWFPKQLNFELWFERYPSPIMGVKAAGRSYITDVQIDPPLKARDFDPEMPLVLIPQANTRADTAWAQWRNIAPLNPKERRTYQLLDSLGDVKNIDRWMSLMDYLATGRAPIRHGLALDLNRLIRLNDFEGVRLGMGLTTAQARPLLAPKRVEGSAYAGYGFQDKSWKYGASGVWRIFRGTQTQLRLGWQRDLLEPGALNELQPAAFVNRSLYARRMDYTEEWVAAFSTRIGKDLSAQLALRQQDVRPGYTYAFGPPSDRSDTIFHFQEATAYLRFARGEKLRNLLGTRFDAFQPWPALEIGYTRGWGQYHYHRLAVALYQSVLVRRLGRADWRIEAGLVTPEVPFAKLFSLNQTGGGFGTVAVRNTFQTLPDTLFMADRFVNVFYAQEIGHILYRTKYSAPFLTLLQNMGWSRLDRPELHGGLGFLSLKKPFYESGLRLDNLIRLNYVNFAHLGMGGAVFYRWGALHSAQWQKNTSWRLTFRMSL